jgi:hypothetical protein
MLPKVFDTLRNEGVKKADIAAELCLALDDLNALTFMLTLSGIPAQEDATLAVVQPSRSANLRLVR